MANPVFSNSGSSFSVSYDSTTKIISAVVCVVLIGGAIAIGSVVAGLVAVLIIGVSYGFSPRGYAISNESVLVRRLLGNARILLGGIREVRAADRDDFRGTIRIFGNGGLFGYYGIFRTSKLGTCNWYVTNRRNAVVLATAARNALFSPDDVNGFISTVKALAPVPNCPPTEIAEGSSQKRGVRWNVIGLLVGVLVLLTAAAALLYAPGPPKYTLTPQGLAIHDRFYPVTLKPDDIDIEHIRIVDIGTDPHWRPTTRTNGFASLHYRSGWFKVAGGEKVRMYRAESRRLVLLPPRGGSAPVLIEVDQPDSFIWEIRQVWR